MQQEAELERLRGEAAGLRISLEEAHGHGREEHAAATQRGSA